ncbi:hypothetical protein LTR51_008610 [Lithohypha guttulata]|nr:hypothetical protein LTR51_008610 [Lithohypha guttulata]
MTAYQPNYQGCIPALTDVIIVGAGLSGICAAIQLRRKFRALNVLILEKSESIGGTWYKNTYPNLSCDIPSQVSAFYNAYPYRGRKGVDT